MTKSKIKSNKFKTVAEILSSCKLGDILSDGKNVWKIVDTDFDGCIVASPINLDGSKNNDGFELWSSGIESIAIIPKLIKL